VHDRKHLILVGPRVFFDSVQGQGLGRAAAALVQRGYEAGVRLDLLQLILVHVERFHNVSFSLSSWIFDIGKSGYWLSYHG
jgi:hypothetical protein